MKCTFTETDFRPAWRAILPPHTDNPVDTEDERYDTAVLRVQASDSALTLRGPYGQAVCPADVERPGVLFVPIRDFVEALERAYGETILGIDATDDYIETPVTRFLCQPWQFALFEPGEAPERWEPPAEEPVEEEDWEETDAAPAEPS